MQVEALHDVVVIGAGAAGVSAAIECFDIQLDVVVLEARSKVGGQIDQIPHTVRNVAPAPDGNDALVDALARHASMLGDRLQLDQHGHRAGSRRRARRTPARIDTEPGVC